MKSLLRYKGFIGTAEMSEEDDVFFGKVIGINDLVSYEGETVRGLKKDFKAAVNEYIDLCKRLNKPIQKSRTENLNMRINAKIYETVAYAATEKGISLNKYVQEAIQSYVQEAEIPYQTHRKK